MGSERLRLLPRQVTTPGAPGASTALNFERHRTLYRARQRDTWRHRAPWLGVVAGVVLLLSVTANAVLGRWAALVVLAGAVLGVAAVGWRAVRLPIELARFRQQAADERETAKRLDRLSNAGYRVLHDRTVCANRGVRLNHVVIGPTGLFVVETRRVTGLVRVEAGVLWDGDLSLQGAMQRVWWIAEQVVSGLQAEAPQWNVVVIPRSTLHGSACPPGLVCEGVGVVPVQNLVRTLSAMAPTIGPMDVAYLGECAERAFPPAAG